MSIPMLLAQTAPAAPSIDDACGDEPSWICERVFDWTGSEGWTRAVDWLLAKPLTIVLVVVIALVVARLGRYTVTRTLRRAVSRRTAVGGPGGSSPVDPRNPTRRPLGSADRSARLEARTETLNAVFRSLLTVLVWSVALIATLEVLGLSLGPLLATAGIAGIALGFGTQTMVRDFISGFFIVVEDQFGVGDTVDLGAGAKGTVERVTLRSTRVRDVEGNLWHVPNGQITRVANRSQEWARALIDIVLPYDVDVDRASAVMQRVADELAADPDWHGEVTARPEVWGIQDFLEHGIEMRLVIKTRPAAQFGVLRELRARLNAGFAAEGIRFAYAGGPTEVILADGRSGAVERTGPDDPLPTSPASSPASSPAMGRRRPGSDAAGFGGEGDLDVGGLADGQDD